MDLKSIEAFGRSKEAITKAARNHIPTLQEAILTPHQRFQNLWDKVQVMKDDSGTRTNGFKVEGIGEQHGRVAIEIRVTHHPHVEGSLRPEYKGIEITPRYGAEVLPTEVISNTDIAVLGDRRLEPEVLTMLGKVEESIEAATALITIFQSVSHLGRAAVNS